jgi:ABC-type phosphate transport system ATPase subunit
MRDLAKDYTIIVVTHNMQQAARVSDYTAFFTMDEDRAGMMVEYGPTTIFLPTLSIHAQKAILPGVSDEKNRLCGNFR